MYSVKVCYVLLLKLYLEAAKWTRNKSYHTWNYMLYFCIVDIEEERAKKDPRYHLKSIASETKDILDELQTTYQEPVSMFTKFVEKCRLVCDSVLIW